MKLPFGRPQFSLRWMLVAVLLVGMPLAWWSWRQRSLQSPQIDLEMTVRGEQVGGRWVIRAMVVNHSPDTVFVGFATSLSGNVCFLEHWRGENGSFEINDEALWPLEGASWDAFYLLRPTPRGAKKLEAFHSISVLFGGSALHDVKYTSKTQVLVRTQIQVAKFQAGKYTGVEIVKLETICAAEDFYPPLPNASKDTPALTKSEGDKND